MRSGQRGGECGTEGGGSAALKGGELDAAVSAALEDGELKVAASAALKDGELDAAASAILDGVVGGGSATPEGRRRRWQHGSGVRGVGRSVVLEGGEEAVT